MTTSLPCFAALMPPCGPLHDMTVAVGGIKLAIPVILVQF